jgi:hypothetical protein
MPPLSVEEASVCPAVIALAVGHAVTVGVALFTDTEPVPLALLYVAELLLSGV